MSDKRRRKRLGSGSEEDSEGEDNPEKGADDPEKDEGVVSLVVKCRQVHSTVESSRSKHLDFSLNVGQLFTLFEQQQSFVTLT